MSKKIFMSLLVFVFFIISQSFAADAIKIGIVDFQKLFETSESGKSAKIDINRQGEKMAADLKKKGQDLEELKKQLEREAMAGKRETIEAKERDYRIKVSDFKYLEQKYNEDFKELNAKIINRLRGEVIDVIQDIGKKEGYLFIIEKREAGIIYSQSQIDITDKIIQLSNEKSKKSK